MYILIQSEICDRFDFAITISENRVSANDSSRQAKSIGTTKKFLGRPDGEPMMAFANLTPTDISTISQYVVDKIYTDPDRCLAYVAIDKKAPDQVAGVMFYTVSSREDYANDLAPESANGMSTNARYHVVGDFDTLGFSGGAQFLPDSYNGKYVRLNLGLTDPEYRGRGLFSRLLALSLMHAHEQFQCSYGMTFATSYRTQSIFEKQGWITSRWLSFDDYYVFGTKAFDTSIDPKQKCGKLVMVHLDQQGPVQKDD